MKEYKYGMRLRGFSLGCQPMGGFLRREDDVSGRYHDIIFYDHLLEYGLLEAYELDYLGDGDGTARK